MMSLAALPEAGGIVWGASSGPTVTVFSDFRCGYCRALSGVLEEGQVVRIDCRGDWAEVVSTESIETSDKTVATVLHIEVLEPA